MPFREAHHITGRAVKAAEERGCDLADLPLDELKAIDARIDDRVFDVLSVDASVAAAPATAARRPNASASRLRRRRKSYGLLAAASTLRRACAAAARSAG